MDESERLLLDNQLCFPLYAASKTVIQRYDPFLKPLGLTYTQYLVLLVLWEEDGIAVQRLGERLKLDSGTLSPLLQKLSQKGLIRKDKGEDARFHYVYLTERGHALKEQAKAIPESMASCLNLSLEESALLYSLCHKIMEGK